MTKREREIALRFTWPSVVLAIAILGSVVALSIIGEKEMARSVVEAVLILLSIFMPSPIRIRRAPSDPESSQVDP